jgi:hypothetical protein
MALAWLARAALFKGVTLALLDFRSCEHRLFGAGRLLARAPDDGRNRRPGADRQRRGRGDAVPVSQRRCQPAIRTSRTESRPYLHLGVLGEIVLGKVSLFANAENILGVRQTR